MLVKEASHRSNSPPPLQPEIVTMPNCRLNCVAVVLVCLAVGSAEGQSLGRWRLPSTPAQFFGCGFGPGHHAPIVRMPCSIPMSVKRLEFVRPSVDQGYCEYAGCVDQPYYGGSSGVQPMPSIPIAPSAPSIHSPDLFSAPAKPIAPKASQSDASKTPDESDKSENSEVLPTPKS